LLEKLGENEVKSSQLFLAIRLVCSTGKAINSISLPYHSEGIVNGIALFIAVGVNIVLYIAYLFCLQKKASLAP